jgi:hypothetical protein
MKVFFVKLIWMSVSLCHVDLIGEPKQSENRVRQLNTSDLSVTTLSQSWIYVLKSSKMVVFSQYWHKCGTLSFSVYKTYTCI